MFTPRTLVALQEATIRNTRGGADAFSRAALGAKLSPGKKSTVYVDSKGNYSYGIASKSTGGKKAPKGSMAVAEITPGTGGAASIRRQPKRGRMKGQLAGIARSSRLSPEEKARYEAAARKKEGRVALPAGAKAAIARSTFGVDSRRKLATGSRKQPAKARTVGALQRVGGVMKAAASRLFSRKRKRRAS